MDKYTCDVCGITDKRVTSHEAAMAEVAQLMPETIHDEMGIVCHDCWLEVMAWYETLTSQQKKQMRREYIKEKTH